MLRCCLLFLTTPDGGSDDGSRRFNKFWLIFLAVVVFLSITVDNDDDVSLICWSLLIRFFHVGALIVVCYVLIMLMLLFANIYFLKLLVKRHLGW